ncbi:N-acetyl-anhydromuramyl-L-alanine amidase AmpD [Bradyrhizobium sp. LM6.10]
MSSGSSTPSGSDSKRQRVLPVPKAAANMRTFEPDSSIVSDIIPSPNHGDRNKGRQPDMIVLHYTGMPDVEGALARLCSAGTEVSAHYVCAGRRPYRAMCAGGQARLACRRFVLGRPG